MAKYTKKDIERLGKKLVAICKKNKWTDVCVYFNNKRLAINDDYVDGKFAVKTKTLEECCPFDYFKWANPQHILSMSFEGYLYDKINYGKGMPESFRKLFAEYDVYWEQGNAWNLTLYPNGDIEDYEYTDYAEEYERCAEY